MVGSCFLIIVPCISMVSYIRQQCVVFVSEEEGWFLFLNNCDMHLNSFVHTTAAMSFQTLQSARYSVKRFRVWQVFTARLTLSFVFHVSPLAAFDLNTLLLIINAPLCMTCVQDPESKYRFDRPTLCDNLRTILLAGHDTTGTALSFAMYLIASHPRVQQKYVLEDASELSPFG